jgi:FKBP-type peptidyl-prolyl cis-trans isomerase 2
MKLGETKTINIPAADGYGPVRDDMIQVVNVEEFTKADIDWTTWNV